MPHKLCTSIVGLALSLGACLPGHLRAQAPLPSAGQSLQVVLLIDVKPDQTASVTPALQSYLASCRHDTSVTAVSLSQQVDRPNHFILLETFSSMQSYTRQVGSAYSVQFRDRLHPFLGSPVDELLSHPFSPPTS